MSKDSGYLFSQGDILYLRNAISMHVDSDLRRFRATAEQELSSFYQRKIDTGNILLARLNGTLELPL